MVNIPFFALTTRGLEFVSAKEIAAVRSVNNVEVAYRRVTGQIAGSPVRLLNLRTVDDVYLAVDTWHNVGHLRSMLPVLPSGQSSYLYKMRLTRFAVSGMSVICPLFGDGELCRQA